MSLRDMNAMHFLQIGGLYAEGGIPNSFPA
jgi:hypothetical protein